MGGTVPGRGQTYPFTHMHVPKFLQRSVLAASHTMLGCDMYARAVLMALALWSRQASVPPFPRRNYQTADSYSYLLVRKQDKEHSVSLNTLLSSLQDLSQLYNVVPCPFIMSHKSLSGTEYLPSDSTSGTSV